MLQQQVPLDVRANWIFRVVPLPEPAACHAAVRRATWTLAVIPILAALAALLFCRWPFELLLTHELVLALIGSILVDCSLYSFRKIPFTCAYLPGKSQVHLMFWFGLIPLVVMIHKCSRAEFDAIQSAAGCCMVVVTFAVVAFALRKVGDSLANRGDWEIEFEDPPPGTLIGLHLNR